MSESLGRDINHFTLKSSGNHGIENIRVAGKLHLPVEQSHRADLAPRHENIEVQSFLGEIAALFCDIGVHDPRSQPGRAQSDFSGLSAGIGENK